MTLERTFPKQSIRYLSYPARLYQSYGVVRSSQRGEMPNPTAARLAYFP